MSRQKRGHSASVPWSEAVELFGSEAVLVEGVMRKTWEGWKSTTKRVPAYRVVALLRSLAQEARQQNRLRLPDPPQLAEAIIRLRHCFAGGQDSADWRMLERMLELVEEAQGRKTDGRSKN
jgi:hypothetical protein